MSNKGSSAQGRTSKSMDRAASNSSSHMTPSSSADREGSGGNEASKPRRGRVNMACLHCRQRKIKCDAQQPQCSNCIRLKRACEYESVTETKNMLSRERRRLGKAKQERLAALAQLGIISPQPSSGTGVRRAASKGSNRNEPTAPYVRFTSDSATKRTGGSVRSRSDTIAAGQRAHPGMLDLSDTGPSVLRRTRGITVSGGYSSGELSVMNTMLLEAQERSSGVNITSLSQPSTPEGTYAFHASMLQNELSDGNNAATYPYPQHYPWAVYDDAALQERPVPWHELQQAQSSSSALSSAQQTPATWPAELPAESDVWSSARRDQGFLQLSSVNTAIRRRSSIPMLPEWSHRPSNADVAVASFFNRVMSAQPPRPLHANPFVASGLPVPPTIIQPISDSYQQTSPSDASGPGSLGRSSSRPISFHDSWGGRSTSSSTYNSSGFGAGSGVEGSNHSSPGHYGVAFRNGSGSAGSTSATSGGPHSPVAASASYPASLSSAAMAATSSGASAPPLSLGPMPPQMMYIPVAESSAATSPALSNRSGFYPATQVMHADGSAPVSQSIAEASAIWAQLRTDGQPGGQLSPDTELSHGMRALGATPILGSIPSGGLAYAAPQSQQQHFDDAAANLQLSPTQVAAVWHGIPASGIGQPAPWAPPEAPPPPTWWTSEENGDAQTPPSV